MLTNGVTGWWLWSPGAAEDWVRRSPHGWPRTVPRWRSLPGIPNPYRLSVTNAQQRWGSTGKCRDANHAVRAVSRVRSVAVVVRRAAVVAACLLISVGMAPPAAADPDAEPAADAAAPADGSVP